MWTIIHVCQSYFIFTCSRPHRPEQGEKTPLKRRIWELFHHNIGRVAVALALVNISLGVFLALAHTAVWALWFVYLIIVVIVFVFFEFDHFKFAHGAIGIVVMLLGLSQPFNALM